MPADTATSLQPVDVRTDEMFDEVRVADFLGGLPPGQ